MGYKLLPEETKESVSNLESLHRIPAQILSKATTSVTGFPGDVASLLNEYVAGPLSEKLTGNPQVPYEQTELGKLLPTSHTQQKGLQEAIPYLKPRTKAEKFIGDVAEDAASIFLPAGALGKIAKGAKQIPAAIRSIATSLGANAGGQFVQDFTGDEKKAAMTKLGLMFMGGLASRPNASKEVKQLYKKANSLLPENATVRTGTMDSNLYKFRENILQGRNVNDLADSEKFVVNEIDKVLRQSEGGEVRVKTLQSALRSLNENLQKAVYDAPSQSTRTRAKKLATTINKEMNQTLRTYGKSNPEWWENYSSASQAFGAINQSKFISNWIKNNAKGGSLTASILHLAGHGVGATGAAVPYQAAKLGYRIYKSPFVRNHYAKLLSAAAAEDSASFNREYEKLEKATQEKNKKKYRLLD